MPVLRKAPDIEPSSLAIRGVMMIKRIVGNVNCFGAMKCDIPLDHSQA